MIYTNKIKHFCHDKLDLEIPSYIYLYINILPLTNSFFDVVIQKEKTQKIWAHRDDKF